VTSEDAVMELTGLKDAARRWITGIWNDQDFTVLEELGSPEYVYRVPGKEEVRPDALPRYVARLHGAFPDLHNTIEAQFAESGTVVTLGTTHGTHLKPLGETPPTGRTIAVPWAMVTRFREGRVVEDLEYYDEQLLLRQLGTAS
jgi:steroid delta-isomerase-like uncharacterized protein